MTSHDHESPRKDLSPTSRRAFLLAVPGAMAAGAAITHLGGCGGGYGDYVYADSCYCNGPGRSYFEVCGIYCDYLNYAD